MILWYKSYSLAIPIIILTVSTMPNSMKPCDANPNPGKNDAQKSKRDDSNPFNIITPVIEIPPNETHTGTIIFLHDYCEEGKQWRYRMTKIQQPYMKIVLPTANNMTLFWIKDEEQYENCWFTFDVNYNFPKGISNATGYVHHLIDSEIKNGIKPERILIGGVAQGAVLALHSAFSYPKKLAGVLALSSWTPDAKIFKESFNSANKDIPILQCHLNCDHCVSIEVANATTKLLKEYATKNVDFKWYPDGHLCLEGLVADMTNFVKTKLAPI